MNDVQTASGQASMRRVFIAIRPGEEMLSSIEDFSQRLQKAATFTPLRPVWTPRDNLYLTLQFLGPVEETRVAQLTRIIRFLAGESAPILLDYRRVGFFPDDGNTAPKVLWLGIYQPPPALLALRESLTKKLTESGLDFQPGQFTPHLTLARLKSAKGVNAFRNILRTYEFVKLGKEQAGSLSLMESITGDGPATYRAIESFPFAVINEASK